MGRRIDPVRVGLFMMFDFDGRDNFHLW